MLALIFLLLRLFKVVNTSYDWLIFALLYIGDSVSDIPIILSKLKGE